MKLHYLDHPWMDEEFYDTGSFISSDGGNSIIFCKGGDVKICTSGEELTGVTFIKKFFGEEYLVHEPRETLLIPLTELKTYVKTFETPFCSVSTEANQDDTFEQDFKNLKPLIPSDLSKAVLLSRQEFSTTDAARLRRSIVARAFILNHGRPYGMWFNEQGIVGCTPETLFEINDGVLESEALAGTAKLGHEQELLSSQKDRAEHDFVIQDLSEKLNSLGLEVSIGETVTKPYSQIIHLKTPVSASIPHDFSVLKLTSRLTPTAALGGYPAKPAKKFLETMEYTKRFPERIFGSVIGHVSTTSVGLVMIRNLQWQGRLFIIESGVGVVADSELMSELKELKMKREVVRNHFL